MNTIKVVKKFGNNGAHVLIPKELIGKKVLVISEEETNPIMRRSEIEKLIDQKIVEAKQGY